MTISPTMAPSYSPAPQHCRDPWVGWIHETSFNNLTCSKCFIQLFANRFNNTLSMHIPPFPPRPPYVLLWSGSNGTQEEVVADPESDPSPVCVLARLTIKQCDMWRMCCTAARQCCQRMMGWQQSQSSVTCPGTWDGVACWSPTSPGRQAAQQCPVYYGVPEALWTSPQASKICSRNATWAQNKYGMEYTHFVPCVDTSAYKRVVLISLYIDIAGNILSVVALVTSIALIVGFRSLRRDLLARDSLKLHLNLFVAMILAGLSSLALHYIYFDKTIIKNNPVWCRILNAVAKYFRSVTYIAIFAEGLYLHRRISRVLYVSRREPLLKYFLISWIVPAITVIVFCVTRVALNQNKGCWMHPANSELEFIYMVPNIVTIVCNVGFLISIEINLCTKMRTDSSDRRVEVLRHALRATLTLIPLFGLQFFFFAYRPEQWPPYEIIHALFISTQGFLVAVVYCLSTKEVRSQLSLFWKHCTLNSGVTCSISKSHITSGRARRRESASSALRERGIERDGYLYMGKHHARHSPAYNSPERYKCHSLPDIMDTVSMMQATQIVSIGSSLCDLKGPAMSRHVSHDLKSTSPRRPSAMSLTMACLCAACGGRQCTCANSTLRMSFLPLLGLSSSDHSSTTSCDVVAPLVERNEESLEMRCMNGEGGGANGRNHQQTYKERQNHMADIAL